MADIRFNCGNCRAKLAIDDSVAGMAVTCPHCGTEVMIPARKSAPKPGRSLLTDEEIELLSKPRNPTRASS